MKRKKILSILLSVTATVFLSVLATTQEAQTPGGGTCTPSTMVTEGDLFPNGTISFGVTSGPGTVTIDHVNTGTGTQSITVVGVPMNAIVNIPAFVPGTFNPVVVSFSVINPALPVDFTLRAASQFHAAFIRVRCAETCTPSATVTEGDLFPGGIFSFGVTTGPGSVTVDHVNAGTGLQTLTVVPGSVINAVVSIPAFAPGTTAPVVVTFTPINPALPLSFRLRAASQFHAAFIDVRCTLTTPTPTPTPVASPTPTPVASPTPTTNTFSGQATGIQANVTIPPAATVTTVVAQTDPLPPGGGAGNSGPGMMFIRQVEQGSVILGGVGTLNTFQTGAISAFTQGGPPANRLNSSRSQATVANLDALILGNSIRASLVQAESVCSCLPLTPTTPFCTPSTRMGLVINGTAINPTTMSVVNLRVGGLPTGDIIGQVFLSQSTRTGTGQMMAITINALRINFTAGELAGTNIIIAQAYSDITCR